MNKLQLCIHIFAITLTMLLLSILTPPSWATDTPTTPPTVCPHTWTFDGATPTWTPDVLGKVVDGNLKIHYTDTSKSGYLLSPALFADAPLYPLRLAMKMKSTASGEGRVFWKGSKWDYFDKSQSMTFPVTHDGQWHECSVDLTGAGNQFVNQLNVQVCSGAGDIEVAWITLSYVSAPLTADDRSAAKWLDIARAETKQQKQWEATHALDSAMLLGAGQYVIAMYGQEPDAKFVKGTPEFQAWWKDAGAAGLEQWAKDDFPMILDRDHLIYNVILLYSAQSTPRSKKTLFVNGVEFANPARFWSYYDRVKMYGGQAYRRACASRKISRHDYDLLRLYAPIVYAMWGDTYLPYDNKMTVGDFGRYPVPGTVAADFTLPTLETVLHSPAYTDAYSFDYRRIFRSEIAAFLLQVAVGYEAIPATKRVPGGPVIKAKVAKIPYADTVTLSSSFGKKPVLLILADGIDGDCLSILPTMESLYQATKDQVDWYLVQDNIVDMQYWSDYYFKPSQVPSATFRKAITYEERAQFAKMASMRYVNLSFPILLDDLALHTENAYADSGGSCSTYLIDKKGVITFFNNYTPAFWDFDNSDGRDGYWRQRNLMTIAVNIKALLENHGLWTGKEMVFPDWQPSPLLAGVKISSIDARAGTLTVPGTDGKDFVLTVDHRTRIVSTTTPELSLPFSDLTFGATVSFTYDPAAAGSGHLAKLLVPGDEGVFKRYLLSSECAASQWPGTAKLWCPAIAKSVTNSILTVTLAPRPRAEIRGLKFWEEAGDRAKPQGTGWMIPIVKDWADHPEQTLTFHLDRATEVLLNGNKATVDDIRPGDHLGVELRQEQKADDRRPFYIYIYRYGTPVAGQQSGTDVGKP